MKHACFACLFLFIAATVFAQSISVPSINQSTRGASPISASQSDTNAQGKALDSYGRLPLGFEANQGQTDARVKFLSRGAGYTLFLTRDEAVLAFSGKKASPDKSKIAGAVDTLPSTMAAAEAASVLRMKLVRANPAAKVTGVDELPGRSNYFIGNDPKKWQTNVPTYAKVKYKNIYSSIDLIYYGNQRQFEYDFVVAPGADPHRIAFDVSGAKRISGDDRGDLVLQTAVGEIRWRKPIVYQEKNGTRQEIAARYVVKHKNRVQFEVADYDLRRPLFIDPLVYSTYLGGRGDDAGYGIAVDKSGNAYVTGTTASTNFPTKNALHGSNAGGYDAFVAKLNPTGSALVYSTYLGGSNSDQGLSIAVDSSGNAYGGYHVNQLSHHECAAGV
jgi:beta-propeller repeat-containing protein